MLPLSLFLSPFFVVRSDGQPADIPSLKGGDESLQDVPARETMGSTMKKRVRHVSDEDAGDLILSLDPYRHINFVARAAGQSVTPHLPSNQLDPRRTLDDVRRLPVNTVHRTPWQTSQNSSDTIQV